MTDYYKRKYFPAHSDIKWRAEQILKNRTKEEVARGVEEITKQISDLQDQQHEEEMNEFIRTRAAQLYNEGGWELAYLPSALDDEVDCIGSEEEIRDLLKNWPSWASDRPDFPGYIDDLTAIGEILTSGFPYDDIDGFAKATEAEVYAALALAKVNSADYFFDSHRSNAAKNDLIRVNQYPWDISDVIAAGALLVEAMEIVCRAEQASFNAMHHEWSLSQLDEHRRNAKEQAQRELGKRGADARKARYEPLRERAKELLQGKNHKSIRSAALSIVDQIVERSKELGLNMSRDQAVITISGWLRDMGLPANVARQPPDVKR